MPDSGRARQGFTLMEVVVSAIIVVLLAAVTMPSVASFIDRQRVNTTYATLQAISAAISNGSTGGFYNLVHSNATISTSSEYPGLLRELANPIATTRPDHDSCGWGAVTHPFSTTAVASWVVGGPFINVLIGGNGLQTPIGLIQDSLRRDTLPTPTGFSGGPQALAIRINGVQMADALMLDAIVDGSDGSLSGNVRWTPATGAVVNVSYEVPISATHC